MTKCITWDCSKWTDHSHGLVRQAPAACRHGCRALRDWVQGRSWRASQHRRLPSWSCHRKPTKISTSFNRHTTEQHYNSQQVRKIISRATLKLVTDGCNLSAQTKMPQVLAWNTHISTPCSTQTTASCSRFSLLKWQTTIFESRVRFSNQTRSHIRWLQVTSDNRWRQLTFDGEVSRKWTREKATDQLCTVSDKGS